MTSHSSMLSRLMFPHFRHQENPANEIRSTTKSSKQQKLPRFLETSPLEKKKSLWEGNLYLFDCTQWKASILISVAEYSSAAKFHPCTKSIESSAHYWILTLLQLIHSDIMSGCSSNRLQLIKTERLMHSSPHKMNSVYYSTLATI